MGQFSTNDYRPLVVAVLALFVSVLTAYIQFYPRESLKGVILDYRYTSEFKDDIQKDWADIDLIIVNSGNRKAIILKGETWIPQMHLEMKGGVPLFPLGKIPELPVVLPPGDIRHLRVHMPVRKDVRTSNDRGNEFVTHCLSVEAINSSGKRFDSEIRVFSLTKDGDQWSAVNHIEEWEFNMFKLLPFERFREL